MTPVLYVALAGEGPLDPWVFRGLVFVAPTDPALANAGFTVAAPDVRGYGGSDKPHPIEAYAIKNMSADIDGLIAALGAEQAIVIGHD